MNPHPPKRRPAIHDEAEQTRADFDAAVEALFGGGHGLWERKASIGGGFGRFLLEDRRGYGMFSQAKGFIRIARRYACPWRVRFQFALPTISLFSLTMRQLWDRSGFQAVKPARHTVSTHQQANPTKNLD